MTFLCLKINHSSPLRKIISRDVLTRLSGLAYCSGVAPHWATGFSSLNQLAGSRLIYVCGFFVPVIPPSPVSWRGVMGERLRSMVYQLTILLTPLRLATPFSSVLARLLKIQLGASVMAIFAHIQECISAHSNISCTSIQEVRHV